MLAGMGTIVVGVDESEGAAAALRWAVAEAGLRACRVTAVMCWGFIDQHHAPGRPTEFDPSYDEAAARQALDDIITAVVPDPGLPIDRRVVNDLATRGLLSSAADADLLVVGARGVGGFAALLLGSVSQHCLHHATIPVAVIRASDPHEDRPARFVVGVDGSEPAERALRWAVAEAHLHHATVEVVHGWSLPAIAMPYFPDLACLERAAGAVLDRAVESVADLDPPIVRRLEYGGAGAVLLDAAEGADLVVVGSRGLGGFKELLLGSVSHQLATHAPCPVVVIPQPDGHHQAAEA